ncbi:MAG: hypothetical protein M3R38_07150 [Actinomycetota bacterium]|nr:hypothetical protein [Actinomycetota bacterium]
MRPYLLWLVAAVLVAQAALPLLAPENRGALFVVGLGAAAVFYAELEAKA